MAGQKGLEVLQLLLASVLVFLSVLALLGTGTEGHWALGRAPCGEDPRRDACCCWRRGFLCVSHASTMLLLTDNRQAQAAPVSPGNPPAHKPWGGDTAPGSCGSRCGPHWCHTCSSTIILTQTEVTRLTLTSLSFPELVLACT